LRDERTVAELVIADDVDAADPGFRSFVDLEDDVDAILVELDDLRFDALRTEASGKRARNSLTRSTFPPASLSETTFGESP